MKHSEDHVRADQVTENLSAPPRLVVDGCVVLGPDKRALVMRRCKRHYPGCSCAPEDVFVCTWCERDTGYCEGASDATPGLCDDCAAKAHDLWEGVSSLTCKHCGEDICDTCWQKRAAILYERDDLRAEVKRLRENLETIGMFAEKMRRGEPAATIVEIADACEAALKVSEPQKPAVQP